MVSTQDLSLNLDNYSIIAHFTPNFNPQIPKICYNTIITKLLLTSHGLTNADILGGLSNLLQKDFSNTNLLYCPTAATHEPGSTTWVNKNIQHLKKLGFSVSICDIASTSIAEVLKALTAADILYFEGGSTPFLMHSLLGSGLAKELPAILTQKIWVGVSAGALVLCPVIYQTSGHWFIENPPAPTPGLALTDFQFIPHLNDAHFKFNRIENIKFVKENLQYNNIKSAYIVDNNTALLVDNSLVQIIGTGNHITI